MYMHAITIRNIYVLFLSHLKKKNTEKRKACVGQKPYSLATLTCTSFGLVLKSPVKLLIK